MTERCLRLLLAGLGLLQLALGGWMMFATHSFGETIAPFNGFNPHDLRDFATFYLALALVLLAAATRPGWRFPILVLATLEYAFHALNHAIDVNNSHLAWIGPAELAALAAATALFAWLTWVTAPETDNESHRVEAEERLTNGQGASPRPRPECHYATRRCQC
jgi:hypothetical protein